MSDDSKISGEAVYEKSADYAKMVADWFADLPKETFSRSKTDTLALALGAIRAAARLWALGAEGTPQLFAFGHFCHEALEEARGALDDFDTKNICDCANCTRRRSMLS